MPFDPTLLPHVVGQVWGEKPHPDIPEIKVNQYPTFARIAALMNHTPQPHPQQVRQAYHAISNAGIAPAEFERVWSVAQPLANRLLGRDPTIHDVHALAGAHPSGVQAYFMEHPHPDYPEVSAGDMIRYYHVAEPIAHALWGRSPNDKELARMVMGGYSADEVLAHYRDDGHGYGAPMIQPQPQQPAERPAPPPPPATLPPPPKINLPQRPADARPLAGAPGVEPSLQPRPPQPAAGATK